MDLSLLGLVIAIAPLSLMTLSVFSYRSDVRILVSPDSIGTWLISYQVDRFVPLL